MVALDSHFVLVFDSEHSGGHEVDDKVVIVHEDGQRLADDQGQPDQRIGPLRVIREEGHDVRERDLEQHSRKGPDAEHFEWDGDEVLVKESTDKEDGDGRISPAYAVRQQRLVKMPQAPLMNRHVPVCPKVLNGTGVPVIIQRQALYL